MQYYLSMKKKEILSFVTTWMDFEGIKLSEISQTEKGKYCMFSLICGILKNQNHRNRGYDRGCQALQVGEIVRCLSKGTNFQL